MNSPIALVIAIGFALPALGWAWWARRNWHAFQQRPSIVTWLGAVLLSLTVSVLAAAAAFGAESRTPLSLGFAFLGGAALAGIVGSMMKWLPHREARAAAIELDQPVIARHWWPTWILWTLAALGTLAIMPLGVLAAYFLQSNDVIDDIDSALPTLGRPRSSVHLRSSFQRVHHPSTAPHPESRSGPHPCRPHPVPRRWHRPRIARKSQRARHETAQPVSQTVTTLVGDWIEPSTVTM